MPKLRWVDDDKARNAVSNVVMKILREDKSLSYGDPKSGNILVHGDNLEALKALLPFYAGRVKCIYIDPPYNTGSAFEHYDDNLEHSTWLDMMYPRLKLLREFLQEDGVMFCHIDDEESAYLKVVMDEIFGRKNYCGQIVWEKKKKPSFLNVNMGCVTEYIHAYAKDRKCSPAFIGGVTTAGKKYPFNNAGNSLGVLHFPAGYVEFNCRDQVFEPQDMSGGNIKTELLDRLEVLNGRNVGDFRLKGEWRYSQDTLNEIIKANERIVISKAPFRPNHIKSGGDPKKMKNLLTVESGMSTYEDSSTEGIELFGAEAFDYPKPEQLIGLLISAVTDKGDLVLDSFLGSGTTSAVSMKMERRTIGIEMGEHAKTHCAVRLKKVVDGEQGGISAAVGWNGGGGFKFYELGEPLLDENGAISEGIDFDTLAAHIWWRETEKSWDVATRNGTFLGVHDGVAYAMLYNGVLHDRSYTGGNVLTPKTMRIVREDIGEAEYDRLIIYGECSKLSAAKLKEEKVEFRQTPYDIFARR